MLNDISLKEAFELVLENITPTTLTKTIPLNEALGEFLAKDIIAKRDAPAFSNSAMDGFGFKHSNNKKLKIIKTIYAGDKFEDFELKEDECVRIMTGAKVPKNVDTVIPIEKCLKVTDEYIEIPEIKKGANVRIKGEEIKKSQLLLKKGTEITPEIAALLASQGIYFVKVFIKPKIAILSSGNELKEPWEEADEDEIYNVNSHAIKALLENKGFNAEIIGIIPDNFEKTVKFINSLKHYDVIITSGGISFGDADFIFKAFKQNGLKELFHGIKLKPGRPTMVGFMQNTLVFAMPGNPISSYLNTFFLAIPALRKLSGANKYYYNFVYAKNKSEFKLNPKKAHTALGVLKYGEWEVINNYKYGSSMLSALAKANSLMVVDEGKEKIKKDLVKIIPFNTDFVEKGMFFN
jgi:molybdopterin molybdotransferase